MRTNGQVSLLRDPAPPETAQLKKPDPLVRPAKSRQSERYAPPPPQTFADLGLPISLVEQLIFKFLYFRGDMIAAELGNSMGLKFSLIQGILETFRMQQLLHVKSSLGLGSISSLLSLTDQGRKVARDFLENNQYIGPAPVPISQYTAATKAQQMPPNWLRPERLAKAYSNMIISEAMLDQIGPAVSSGKSLLLYGQPGNGKTFVAEALARIQTTDIYVPYALEYQGDIIQLFDPTCHHRVEIPDSESDCEMDARWVRCRRPFITSGGELSVGMLDLRHSSVSGIYDAPLQLKANNGIYLVDDFGRQMSTPAEILNRWIVPMDRRIDYLSLAKGGKMAVPFETFLVFSTNLNPSELGDEAFLRRIQYKVLLRSPDEYEFQTIFKSYCETHGLQPHPQLISRFIERYYTRTGKAFRRCHPRDLIAQVMDHIHFRNLPHELTEDLLDRAFESCFLQSADIH
jgi:DNA-binding MarR family transcriptional regulator